MRPSFPVLTFPSVLVPLSLIVAAAQTSNEPPPRDFIPASTSAPAPFQQIYHVSTSYLALTGAVIRRKYQRTLHGQLGFVDMVQLIALCSIVQGIRLWRKRSLIPREHPGISDAGHAERNAGGSTEASWRISVGSSKLEQSEAESTDPGLLKKYSSFESYTTSSATYPTIRTFYRPHPQADKLPSKPTPLPLLVFIHGLGGSLAQFNPLLTSLVNVAPCLGIDLPGCGRSAFSPTSWDAFTPKALAELLSVVIRQHCDKDEGQGAILIGHSMGCSLSALVASTALSSQVQQNVEILAVVGICPQATPPSEKQTALFEKLLLVPTPIFDIWRTWDRRGGPESASVARFVGKDADIEVKKLQVRFNEQSQTAVWRRMASGLLPSRPASKTPEKGMPGIDVWASLKLPLFLIAGEGDSVVKTDQIVKIGKALGKVDRPRSGQSKEAPSPSPEKRTISNGNAEPLFQYENRQSKASVTELTVIGNEAEPKSSVPSYARRRQVLKTSILPLPASHALLYDPATYRTLAGLIHTFLYEHVDTRLSLGWQLQHLSTEGKWDVKNLAKWQAVRPVSEPIAGIFRAMKTLREIDDTHSPDIFVRNWRGKIKAVVDISHENPVYDPKGLDEGGIEYHKSPTVSKIPPTSEEAKDFIKLVDRLRAQPPEIPSGLENDQRLIGVHCHYGFNRTGFFICCYLIEKEQFGVQQAIDEFAKHRPPGIRHDHFLDQLFVRYCIGLKRAPTM
ncbi:MAG: hypothetical protein ASARMPREDX12_007029 [Alectoria sarmentosa]|nr:MAG: hypothetical protein ASARMPREDX12_007029 [Alectoria sarmentosa]